MVCLVNPLKKRADKIQRGVQVAVMVFSLFLSVLSLIFLNFNQTNEASLPDKSSFPLIDHLKIGKGALSLSPRLLTLSLEGLAQELVLIGKKTRPREVGGGAICLGLKSSGEKKELMIGERTSVSKQKESYTFVDNKKNSFSLLPLNFQDNRLFLQIEGPFNEQEEIVLSTSPLFYRALNDEIFLKPLENGRLWKPDLFLSQWGGEEYKSLSSKYRVEIADRIFFLSVGDLLWWDGDEWQRGEGTGCPVATVVSASSQQLKLKVWDSTGYQVYPHRYSFV